MKIRNLIVGNLAGLLLVAISAQAAETSTTFVARPGSKMRIEGTSNIHDWQVESPVIGGTLEVGPGFPTERGQTAAPGKAQAKADAFITVRSLKSKEKDGRPYSDSMDDVMWGKLKNDTSPRILFHLTELTFKEAPKSPDDPYVYDAKGELAVAGVTNTVSMPVNVRPLPVAGDAKRLKISGTTSVKMTDFKIDPPAPKIAMGMIKTGDEIKLIFDWVVESQPPKK
jgi:polyisoprenoid-binding protein YceI